MARINVNPTRMELKKLKARLKTAQRGYKLLKAKTDEMVRRFSVLIRETKRLRDATDEEVLRVLRQFSLARGVLSKKDIERIFSIPPVSLSLDCVTVNVLNVEIPKLHLEAGAAQEELPYSFADVTSEADHAVRAAGEVVSRLLRLAEMEKACAMLSGEIERSKRRVNALEYVMIPDLEETIRYISQKLEENERGNLTRLMKVKSMLEERG